MNLRSYFVQRQRIWQSQVRFTVGNPIVSTRSIGHDLSSTAKGGSVIVPVYFSQPSLNPNTEPWLSHPPPVIESFVSGRPYNELPDAKLSVFLSRVTDRRQNSDWDGVLSWRDPGTDCDVLPVISSSLFKASFLVHFFYRRRVFYYPQHWTKTMT